MRPLAGSPKSHHYSSLAKNSTTDVCVFPLCCMNEQPRQTLKGPGERGLWEASFGCLRTSFLHFAWNNPDPHNHNPHSRSPTARHTIGVRAMQMQCKAVWVHASFLMSHAWWVSETALICKANAMHHITKTMEKFYPLRFFVIIIIVVSSPGMNDVFVLLCIFFWTFILLYITFLLFFHTPSPGPSPHYITSGSLGLDAKLFSLSAHL